MCISGSVITVYSFYFWCQFMDCHSLGHIPKSRLSRFILYKILKVIWHNSFRGFKRRGCTWWASLYLAYSPLLAPWRSRSQWRKTRSGILLLHSHICKTCWSTPRTLPPHGNTQTKFQLKSNQEYQKYSNYYFKLELVWEIKWGSGFSLPLEHECWSTLLGQMDRKTKQMPDSQQTKRQKKTLLGHSGHWL